MIAGLAAAAHPDDSSSGSQTPTPEEAAAFLADYESFRSRPFSRTEQAVAAAATAWNLAYVARCQIEVQAIGLPLPEGPVLGALDRHRSA